MRGIFILIMVANVFIFAIGRGWLGIPPAESGREPAQMSRQLNPETIVLPNTDRRPAATP